MLRLLNKPHDGGAKDGEFEMSLGRFLENVRNSGRSGANGWLQDRLRKDAALRDCC